eukprot:10998849-Karenia_brevis.AAC.1
MNGRSHHHAHTVLGDHPVRRNPKRDGCTEADHMAPVPGCPLSQLQHETHPICQRVLVIHGRGHYRD